TTWSVSNFGLTSSTVNAIQIDPTTPATIYAGTLGGVFKSTDSSATWTSVNNNLVNFPNATEVLSLVMNQTAPSTLYAGTHGGSNWPPMSSGLPTSNAVNALAFDPTNPNTIFAATDSSGAFTGGVFKSTNGGSSWTPLVKTGFNMLSLAIHPTNPSVIYGG